MDFAITGYFYRPPVPKLPVDYIKLLVLATCPLAVPGKASAATRAVFTAAAASAPPFIHGVESIDAVDKSPCHNNTDQ